MWRLMLPLGLCVGCATAGFHPGPTTLAKEEQGYLKSPPKVKKGSFERFWQSPKLGSWGLVTWNEDKSSAPPGSPPNLLQTIRDELGRLNQRDSAGEPISLSVTVYQYGKGGFWTSPNARYELVARDKKGKILWAADDKITASEELSQSLVDPPHAIMAREILRRIRAQFGV